MPFAFLTPWILGFLAVLPVLWWLLRLTPPAPKKIIFPALMLLRDIVVPSQVPARTPWWLLLLRLATIALIIVAFAEPVLHPAPVGPANKGALLIAVDNDWAAARAWELRQDSLRKLIESAEREQRPVALLATTPSAQGDAPRVIGPLAAAAALHEIDHIQPQPWPADWQKARQALVDAHLADVGESFWLASGVGGIDAKGFSEALQHYGALHVRTDAENPIYALQLLKSDDDAQAIQPLLAVLRAQTDAEAGLNITALAANGDVLAQLPVHFTAGAPRATVPFDLPLDVRNRIARFEIEGQRTAAAALLLDTSWQHRPVGLVGAASELDQHSLLSSLFYLDRALKPYADLHIDNLDALLQQKMAVIIIPDSAALSDTRIAALKDWVQNGGVLVRFAGAHMAGQGDQAGATADDSVLLPVGLRTGNRALGGTLSWDTPQKLQAFPATSPFHGLDIPADVTVSRQILAEPSADLAKRSWASLADGTPLVTAKPLGQGLTILFHVPVTSDWSNLPLSGLFVDMLRRIVDLAHGVGANADSSAAPESLPPLRLLDAFGDARSAGAPNGAAQALVAADLDHTAIGPQHPPGLYGRADHNRAFNLGPALGQPVALNGIDSESYRLTSSTQSLKPALLVIAFVVLLADFIISLHLRGLRFGIRRKAPVAMALLLLAGTNPAQAADKNGDAIEFSAKTYLAYVETGDREQEHRAAQGLQGLARILQNRTSMDRVAVTGVDPESADLALFPLLYWPLSASETPVSPAAAQRVNDYLAHGGMILFDSMTGEPLPPVLMQHLLAGIAIPPLVRLPENHVLKHSYYLLDTFPGRYDNDAFWLEPDDASAHDGVATVLLGSNGWAAAWAADDSGRPLFPCTPGGEIQRERAYRFGVNLVMYALTGNYKSDQLHAQALLQKLGK